MEKYFLEAFNEIKRVSKQQFDHCIECCKQDGEEFDIEVVGEESTIVVKRQLSK
jgi:hypothetical protein